MRFLTSFLIFLMISPLALAQNVVSQDTFPELKYESKIAQKEFIVSTQRIEETPYGDKLLAYRVRLPTNWDKVEDDSQGKLDLNSLLLGEVAKYAGPVKDGIRPVFILRALEIEYLISTRNWAIEYLQGKGFTPRGFREVNSDRVEVEYVTQEKGVTSIVRSVIIRNGNRMVMAEFTLPTSSEQITREIQILSMQTFRLLNRSEVPPVELEQYNLTDNSGFLYPKAWQLVTVNKNEGEDTIVQLAKGSPEEDTKKAEKKRLGQQDGVIDIYYLSKNNLSDDEEILSYLDEVLSSKNLKRFGEAKITEGDIKRNRPNVNLYSLRRITGKGLDYDFLYAVKETTDKVFIISMITPDKTVDFSNWARNNATFELVASSSRLNQLVKTPN